VHFVAYDGNGNVAALVKATDGSISARYEYGPFGEPVRQTGALADAQPFRFSTKWTDDESGLLYYGYRYYNPSTGRWPNRDPIGEQGGTSLYGVVDNNLMNHVDALGLQSASLPVRPTPFPPSSSQESACRRFEEWYQKEKTNLIDQPNWLSGLPDPSTSPQKPLRSTGLRFRPDLARHSWF
jgi:RHS repeat-associated protein